MMAQGADRNRTALLRDRGQAPAPGGFRVV